VRGNGNSLPRCCLAGAAYDCSYALDTPGTKITSLPLTLQPIPLTHLAACPCRAFVNSRQAGDSSAAASSTLNLSTQGPTPDILDPTDPAALLKASFHAAALGAAAQLMRDPQLVPYLAAVSAAASAAAAANAGGLLGLGALPMNVAATGTAPPVPLNVPTSALGGNCSGHTTSAEACATANNAAAAHHTASSSDDQKGRSAAGRGTARAYAHPPSSVTATGAAAAGAEGRATGAPLPEKKERRMQSNRESARRSRKRKQEHMEVLEREVRRCWGQGGYHQIHVEIGEIVVGGRGLGS
jgi:hypothetical protein